MGLEAEEVVEAIALRIEGRKLICPPNTALIFMGRWKNPFQRSHASGSNTFLEAREATMRFEELMFKGLPPADASIPNIITLRIWREAALRNAPLLRGRDIGCWCPLDWPCHRAVWLRLAKLLPEDDRECMLMINKLREGGYAHA